jgi:ParB/RepB/Spo0J family partition protein
MAAKKRRFIDVPAEPVVQLDAAPITSLVDAVALAAGLPTSADKAKADEHFNEPFMVSSTYATMAVEELRESDTNPRKTFHGIDELAASLEKVGVLVPLLVRPISDGKKVVHEVVAGNRRLRAAKLAGLLEVPVDVRDLTDVQVLEVQLVENIQRSDLTPLEEADGYDALMQTAGYTADQVAAKAGKSRAWVYSRLKLRSLCAEGRKALDTGALSTTLAVALARVPSHKDQAKALESILDMPVRDALEHLQKAHCVSLKGAPFDRKDDMLVPDVGACTVCPKRSGSTPGLFDDLSGSDWCTDTTCFAQKARATWEEKATKAESKGAEALTIDAGKKLFKHGNELSYGSKYVEADVPAPEDKSKRTWVQLLEKVPDEDRPKLFVAPDTAMGMRKMYVERDALDAIAKHLDLKWATSAIEKRDRKAVTSDPVAQKDATDARQLRDEVVGDLVRAAAGRAKKEGLTVTWARILARAADRAAGLEDVYRSSLRIDDGVDVETWIGTAAKEELLGFLVCNLLPQLVGSTWSGFEEEASEVAKVCGLDLEQMVKAKLEKPKEANE